MLATLELYGAQRADPRTCANVTGATLEEQISNCADLLSVEYRIPAVVIKGMIEMESRWNQNAKSGLENTAKCWPGSSRYGYGLTQFTKCELNGAYYEPAPLGTIGFDTWDGDNEFTIVLADYDVDLNRIKNDWKYNLEIGVQHLLLKKKEALQVLKNYDANVLENWYLVLAGYNGISPTNDPAKAWTRDTNFTSSHSYPYQERVFNIIAQREALGARGSFFGKKINATLPGPSAVHNANTNAPYVTPSWGFGACPNNSCAPDSAQFSRHGKVRVPGGERFMNGGFPTSGIPHVVDFGKPAAHVVTPPIEVDQYSGSSITPVPAGGDLAGTTATFRAKLFTGIDSEAPLRLEVELLRVDEWNGLWPQDHEANGAIHASSPVANGGTAVVSVFGLIPGCYHWRARTADAASRRSVWFSYGGKAIAATDFRVAGSVCTSASGTSVMACSSTPPTVTAPAVTAITQTSASLSASLTNGGLPANGWFELSASGTSSVTPQVLVSASGAQPIRANVSSLDCGTTYSVHAAASSAVATTPGASTTFTTTPCLTAHTLTVTTAGNGTGSVSSNPLGISCPSACSAPFPPSTFVTLSASASSGSTFGGWSGDCAGLSTCSVTLTASRFVTATFHAAASPLLSVNVDGSGSVASAPAGIACSSSCSAPFAAGTPVTLTAQPASGWLFAGWSGDCSGSGACQVTLSHSRSVGASFASGAGDQPLSVSTSGGGFVTSDPIGIHCGATCRVNYSPGATVSLTPHHATGWKFTGWSGDCSGTGGCSVVMNQPRNVAAQFSTTTDQVLNLSPTGPQGSQSRIVASPGTLRCYANANCSNDTFPFSSVARIEPIPQAGHPFTAWNGDCAGFAECALAMNQPRNVGAAFTACTSDCPPGATYVHEDFRDGWPQFPEYTITGGQFSAANDRLNVRYCCVRLPVTYHRTETAGLSIDADVRINDPSLGAFRIFALYDTVNGCTSLSTNVNTGYALYLTNEASYSGRDADALVAFTDGAERTIATTPRSLVTGQWAHVRLELWPDGPVRVYVDGRLVMVARDTTFRSGPIALSGAGESTDIDNVVVQSLAASMPPPAPQVFGVTPSTGPASGGTPITVTGTNFTGGTTLVVGGATAASIQILSPTRLTAVTPAHAPGTVAVAASTEGAAGTPHEQAFTFVATAPAVPQNVRAAASGSASATVTWMPSGGADRYEIARSANGIDFTVTGTVAAPPFQDPGTQNGVTYGYRVRAFAGELASAFSAADVATVMAFADPVLQHGTRIRAVHLAEARQTVNALRVYAGLSAAAFTDPSPAGVRIKAVHIQELRSALNAARAALGLPAISHASPATAGTVMTASAINEIRSGVE